MTLKEYAQQINKLLEESPEKSEHVVVYSRDDEGNAFQKVSQGPQFGLFDEYGDFYEVDDLLCAEHANAVIIN